MSVDPNGTRWSKSEKNFGRALLERAGWEEGRGLGVDNSGSTTHVRVQRKDSVTGIGYDGGVQQAWSAQSVGFADVLARIKNAVHSGSEEGNESPAAGEEEQGGSDSNSNSSNNNNTRSNNNNNNGPSGGRHVCMYAKRHALKTELLRSSGDAASAEILGSASSVHKRRREKDTESGDDNNNNDNDNNDTASTLQSPLLQRLMVRMPKHEPRRTTTTTDASETVRITKPQPRPPKCTDTPFLLKE